ncbi:sugar phosphate isomerase/epimerase family protein [Candidatus Dependentiae bacterium]
MKKIGLKLWSTNKYYSQDIIKFYDQGLFDYIELFAYPASYKDTISLWKSFDIPYIIHGAHSNFGFNLSKKDCSKTNIKLADEAKRFADKLNAEIIIFHPGIDGDIKETVKQFNKIKDERVIVENKPYYTIDKKLVCNGNSPEEIDFVLKNTGIGFCLDFGHAICSANAQNKDWFSYLKEFLEFNPKMFHLSDGDITGVIDQHRHLGDGSFDYKRIFSVLQENFIMSIETEKKHQDSLRDFKEDIRFLSKII